MLQITALLAGISRVGGDHGLRAVVGLGPRRRRPVRLLLATPADPGRGRPQAPLPRRQRRRALHGEVVLGVVVAAITAYLSVGFLVRYFETRTLTPVANYCPVFRAASILRLAF